MPYPTLMYMHYVMEAQDYFREALQQSYCDHKLDRLKDALKLWTMPVIAGLRQKPSMK